MGSRILKVDESGMLTGRPGRGLIIINIVAVLAVIIAVAVITLNGREREDVAAPESVAPPAEPFDYEAAADLSAYRWQAMAEFYENNGMLTRPAFDYKEAADLLAYRWQAMAEFYEDHGLLTRP